MSAEESVMLMFAMATGVMTLFVLYDWWTRRKDRRPSSRR